MNNGRRRKTDRLIFEMVHDLEKMAIYFKGIDEYISTTSSVCPARQHFKKIVAIYDKVMMDGCKYIKEAFNE